MNMGPIFNGSTETIEANEFPTSPSTISELNNLSHDVSKLHKIRLSTDVEALKLEKGSSGKHRQSELAYFQ